MSLLAWTLFVRFQLSSRCVSSSITCCACSAQTVMRIVDAVVKRTNADVTDSAKVLQDILAAAANERGEWELPLSQEKTAAMRKALEARSDSLSEVGNISDSLLTQNWICLILSNCAKALKDILPRSGCT